jgi:hypothetical protein
MNNDAEIAGWRTEWLSQPQQTTPLPTDLRLKAAKQQRLLRGKHALELLTAIALFVFSAVTAWQNPTAEICLWAAVIWATTAAVTAFSFWNWYILWQCDLNSVSDYAQTYKKRTLASLRAAHFGLRLLVLQLSISVPWLLWDYFQKRSTVVELGESIAFVACFATVLFLLLSRSRRVALAELDEVERSQEIPGE